MSWMWIALVPAASGHAFITSHVPRTEQYDIKEGPCGLADAAWGAAVYRYAPGDTLSLTWDEYIDHPGYYRIAFDPDGGEGLVDPADFEDFYTNDLVLADDIADRDGGGEYSHEVQLPDEPCETCTLQLVQVMTDKAPYGDGNDLYYGCVDLVLDPDLGPGEFEGPPTQEDPADEDAAGCGCTASGSGALGWLGLGVLGALIGRRQPPQRGYQRATTVAVGSSPNCSLPTS